MLPKQHFAQALDAKTQFPLAFETNRCLGCCTHETIPSWSSQSLSKYPQKSWHHENRAPPSVSAVQLQQPKVETPSTTPWLGCETMATCPIRSWMQGLQLCPLASISHGDQDFEWIKGWFCLKGSAKCIIRSATNRQALAWVSRVTTSPPLLLPFFA